MPPDGTLVCCDVSEEWTAVARRYWAEAGVADRVDLRPRSGTPRRWTSCSPAVPRARSTSRVVDARKSEYPDYHERVVRLLRSGGLAAYDNVLVGRLGG